MFSNKTNRKYELIISQLQEKLRDAERELESARVDNLNKSDHLERQAAELRIYRGLEEPLSMASNGTKLMQGSLSAMATNLKEEAVAAVKVARSTEESKNIVAALISKISELIEKSRKSSVAISNLHEQTKK